MKEQEFKQMTKCFVDDLKAIVNEFPTSWQKKKGIIDMLKNMIAKHMHSMLQEINALNEEFEENEGLVEYIEDEEIALITQKALENELEMDIAELQNKTIENIQTYSNLLENSYTLYYNPLIPLQYPLEPAFLLDMPHLEPAGVVDNHSPLVIYM